MGRSKNWTESDVVDGRREVRFRRWRDCIDYLCEHLPSRSRYIWRGQRCEDWGLVPSLVRRFNSRRNYVRTGEVLEQYEAMLSQRIRSAYEGSQPRVEVAEPWPLGQHYSAYTPLLDWTNVPGYAGFFAYREHARPQTKNRVIWALDRQAVEERAEYVARHGYPLPATVEGELPARPASMRKPPLGKELEPLLTSQESPEPSPAVGFECSPTVGNPRLRAQDGLFSRHRCDLVEWVPKAFRGEEYDAVLYKFLVPDSERARCLEELEAMNIHEATMFPDVEGAVRYCNRKLNDLLGTEGR